MLHNLQSVTTPVRALVQTGEAANLGREPDLRRWRIGLTAEAGGFARLNHWLTPVVTIPGPSTFVGVRSFTLAVQRSRIASR